MIPLNAPPAKSGAALVAAMYATPRRPDAIVDQLIYSSNITTFFAESSSGKSMLAAQLALSVASGTPVFGHFAVPTAVPVYFLSFETNEEDDMRRLIQLHENGLAITSDNFCWDSLVHGVDMHNPAEFRWLIERIKFKQPGVRLIIIDTLTSCTVVDLAKGEHVKALMATMHTLRRHFPGCAVLLLHHTNKGSKNDKGVVESTYYGSSSIKNDSDLMFKIIKKPKQTGTRFFQEKDRTTFAIERFELFYDPQTFTSSYTEFVLSKTHRAVVSYFSDKRNGQMSTITLQAAASDNNCSPRTLTRVFESGVLTGIAELAHRPGHEATITVLAHPVPETLDNE